MKIKFSIKTWLLVFLILNSNCIELSANLKKASKSHTISKSKTEAKYLATKVSHKLKSSTTTKEPLAALYIVNMSIEAITGVINGYIADKEAKIKELKGQNLSTLANMYEEVKLLKTCLCNNIRNSNFLFFDLLSFIIMDIYLMRKKAKANNLVYLDADFDFVQEKEKLEALIKDPNTNKQKLKKKLTLWKERMDKQLKQFEKFAADGTERVAGFNSQSEMLKERKAELDKLLETMNGHFLKNNLKMKKSRLSRKSSPKSKISFPNIPDEELDEALLMPYDQMSQNLFEVKQIMKSFQNRICSINEDAIGEITYIEARSRGLAASIQEDNSGIFFLSANLILDFSSSILTVASQAIAAQDISKPIGEQDILANTDNVVGIKESAYEQYKIMDESYTASFPLFMINPAAFFDEQFTNIKKILKIFRINSQTPVLITEQRKEENDKIKREFTFGLLSFITSVIIFYEFIEFVISSYQNSQIDPKIQTSGVSSIRAEFYRVFKIVSPIWKIH